MGVALNTAYILAETVLGIRANSVALLADAAHNLGDVLGLIAAWIASVLVRRPTTSRFTYGLRGSSWLAALFNASLLFVALGGIAWEALLRLANPEPVVSSLVIGVAAVGILVNGGTALMFISGQKHDVNIRAAFLHMATDALAALGVVIAGILMRFTGKPWIDPAISLAVVAFTLWSTWGLLKDSLNLAMNAVPPEIDMKQLRTYLLGLPGVVALHDLHVWGMSTTEAAFTVHLVMPTLPESQDAFLREVALHLHDQFEIEHPTIQLETGDPAAPCPLAP